MNPCPRHRRVVCWGSALVLGMSAFIPGCGVLDVEPGAEGLLQGGLSGRRGPRPIEAASMAIDPYNANNRYLGTLALANASFAAQEPYVALFVDNINDPDSSVRSAAARGLANHGEASHVPLLLKLLRDEDPRTRLEAVRGLQRLHNAQAVAPLLALVDEAKEPDSAVRAEAALALGQYRENRVLRGLIAALADSQLTVVRSAQSSLSTLTDQSFGEDRSAWADWLEAYSEQSFAQAREYQYPVFNRDKRFYEYLPLVPPPPNETASVPAGWPR
jgi:HEAT repeats/PBS lyase HEAT-like repeat